MAGAKYEITATNGAKFQVEAADDDQAQRIEAFINERIASGETDPAKWSGIPDNGSYAGDAAAPPAVADPEQELFADIGIGVAELGRGVLAGGANVLDKAADWLEGGVQAATGIDLGQAGASIGLAPQNDLEGQVAPARPGLEPLRSVGRFAGETAATLPLAALRGGAVAQGVVGGALLSESPDAIGVVIDAAIGGASAKVGQAAFNRLSGLANPQLDDGLATLVREGVRVTPGQRARAGGEGLGSRIAAATEDRASSLPFVGDAITRDRVRSVESFNTAAINRALTPLGEKLPNNLKAGRRAIRYAGDKLSAAYDDLLPTLTVRSDDQLTSDLTQVHVDAAEMNPTRVDQFNNILRGMGRFFRDGSVLDGEALKAIETRLGDKARRFSRSTDADQQELGDALQSVLTAVREAAARQNGQAAERLRAINQGWASLTQVERAGLTSKGAFGPAGYSQAVRASSATTRSRGYARGQALNQDLSDAASDILPSEVPDSGTSGRWAQANPLGLLAGLAGVPAYGAAQGVNAAMLREGYKSPALARLLSYGAKAAPIAAPAAIETLRNGAP